MKIFILSKVYTNESDIKKNFAHRIRISACFTWADKSYLTHDRIKSREFNTLVVLEVTYLRRQVKLVFTAVTSKNDVTLCKLDVNVKNRTPVTGTVSLFKLE